MSQSIETLEPIIYEVAYHEAAHTLVGMAARRRFSSVCITPSGSPIPLPEGPDAMGMVQFEPWCLLRPLYGGSLRWPRRCLQIDVAGAIGEELYEQMEMCDGFRTYDQACAEARIRRLLLDQWLTPQEASSLLPADHPAWVYPHRLSSLLRVRPAVHQTESDPASAVANARMICEQRSGPGAVSFEEILSEIQEAERVVERFLKRRYDLLDRLACSLVRRSSGRMTERQVYRLLGAPLPREEVSPHGSPKYHRPAHSTG
jgi:hypothetical protein